MSEQEKNDSTSGQSAEKPRPMPKTVMGMPWKCSKCGTENAFVVFECSKCKSPKNV